MFHSSASSAQKVAAAVCTGISNCNRVMTSVAPHCVHVVTLLCFPTHVGETVTDSKCIEYNLSALACGL